MQRSASSCDVCIRRSSVAYRGLTSRLHFNTFHTSRLAQVQTQTQAQTQTQDRQRGKSTQGPHQTETQRPLRACIIGSGPAGFYTAHKLLQTLPSARIDIYESLPVPYGLARFGVAPDHPDVKNVTHTFDAVAASPRVRFLGNVTVGGQDDKTDENGTGTGTGHAHDIRHGSGSVCVSVSELRRAYDAICFAHGAAQSRGLDGVRGTSLPGVVSARSFVGWYNGLPAHASLPVASTILQDTETAVVVGHGNVALDVARMLVSPIDVLRRTDIANHALDALSRHRVKRVRIVGRRGPVQAAFTIKEVRELINMPGVTFTNREREMYRSVLDDAKQGLARPQKRLMELLAKQETKIGTDDGTHTGAAWDIEYLQSPQSFNSDTGARLQSITMGKNELEVQGLRVSARPTGETITMEAQAAFLSIGYQSEPISGMSDLGIVFDTTRHILPNTKGRVESLDSVVEGVYCAGWAKVGPVGVIASTMRDAFETADSIVEDWLKQEHVRDLEGNADALVEKLIRDGQVVTWEKWKRIERYEQETGAAHDPPRPACKIVDVQKMLEIAG